MDSIVVSDLHLDITNTTSDLGACKTRTRDEHNAMKARNRFRYVYFEYRQRFPVFDSFHTFPIYRQYTVAFSDTSVFVRRTSAQHFIHLREHIGRYKRLGLNSGHDVRNYARTRPCSGNCLFSRKDHEVLIRTRVSA